jgi:hypothetical protein
LVSVACGSDPNTTNSDPLDPSPLFTHVADNQTLHPVEDLSPQSWFSYPEAYQYAAPKITHLAIDEPVSESFKGDWIHACICEFGVCQSHRYEFGDYSGSGPIQVHDLNIRLHLEGCLDAFDACSGPAEPVVVNLTVAYYIQGQFIGSRIWEHFAGGNNCIEEVFVASFSNLSFSRGQVNSLEVQVTIGGQPFCPGSTLVTICSIEAECIAGEVHGGGCHCDPSG